jgi:hypothetical protein
VSFSAPSAATERREIQLVNWSKFRGPLQVDGSDISTDGSLTTIDFALRIGVCLVDISSATAIAADDA